MREAKVRPGTLRVLEPADGLIVSPTEGMVLWFGRNRPDVHICVGADDLGVSRVHGALEYSGGSWWVRTLGVRPLKVGRGPRLLRGADPVPLPDGRTSIQVEGINPNEVHVVRVDVAGAAPLVYRGGPGTVTRECRTYALSTDERLVLTVIAQRLLRGDPEARLLTSRETVDELDTLQPGVWTPKKVEHLVKRVRDRLAARHAGGVDPPSGDKVHDDSHRRKAIDVLIDTGTLGADDLRLLDHDEDPDGDAGGDTGGG